VVTVQVSPEDAFPLLHSSRGTTCNSPHGGAEQLHMSPPHPTPPLFVMIEELVPDCVFLAPAEEIRGGSGTGREGAGVVWNRRGNLNASLLDYAFI